MLTQTYSWNTAEKNGELKMNKRQAFEFKQNVTVTTLSIQSEFVVVAKMKNKRYVD